MTEFDQPEPRRLPRAVLRLSRAAVWLMAAVVAIASLLPGRLMPDLGTGYVEHFGAYWLAGLFAALGYGARLGHGALLVAAVALAGFFELAHLFLPQRSASWPDFFAGGAGALLGVSGARLIRGAIGRRWPAEPPPRPEPVR